MLSAIETQKPILSDKGAIFGFVSSSLLRIKAAKEKRKIQGQLR
jgi:hypothetical protein